MKTLNLKIKDEYFDKIVSFLELLPKKSIIIEKDAKQQKLDEIKNSIKNSKQDIENKNTKFIRKIY
ncbi:hypothetical protein Q6A86_04850 [Aliarcobacter skirrowii]|uniref:hypothetical protein n=1 Tax=Aliarcobacter skirrowii TaxID=28200 RepID=UPI0029B36DA4|nr:hypothetical protein [Aliarcobacter skirrowii]MDX4012314.1 hypothetical protein [Aliarcobacter skirrowii]MDX4065161.1 hypothetical protein [Aliarcobacter skirrowii]